jgi:hypothetical protein
MQIVSPEPIVLIGPGSEWFWTALSGFVLAVTFLAIWRQLRVQQSANAFAQVAAFDAELQSERLVWAAYDVLKSIADGVAPSDVPAGPASALGSHWESVGLLVRGGHLDRRVAYTSMSYSVQYDWAVLAPFAAKIRAATGMPAIFEHFEWLAGDMHRMDRARGGGIVIDDEYLASHRQTSLESLRDQIRAFERSKVVYVRDAPAPDAIPNGDDVSVAGSTRAAASEPPVG